MKSTERPAHRWLSLKLMPVVVGVLTAPVRLAAQQPYPIHQDGESAIWQGSTGQVNSVAIVDATPFYNPPTNDICSVISTILSDANEFACGSKNPKGVVVDARGITAGGTLQCKSTSSNPFNGCSGAFGENLTVTLLLPAATIQVQRPWVIPSNARVVGEGRNLTTIKACTSVSCTGAFSGPDVIQMGSSTICPQVPTPDCQGIGIEHLTVDAQNIASLNGIHNSFSQELSYVNDVALNNIAGTGLLVDGSSGHSGPYSNISFSGTGTCAQIIGSNTRGIHGLTCTATGSGSSAAVLLDAPSNSIEDVYINGLYQNGILVGSNGPAQGNLLFNINGTTGVTNVVAISNAGNPPNVSDLSTMGITTSNPGGSVFTISDSLTNTFLHDGSVGMYVVGEPVTANSAPVGYSRFTTSPSVPAWSVGSGSPSGTCSTGSMYSDTTGPSTQTLWACVNGGWKKVR